MFLQSKTRLALGLLMATILLALLVAMGTALTPLAQDGDDLFLRSSSHVFQDGDDLFLSPYVFQDGDDLFLEAIEFQDGDDLF